MFKSYQWNPTVAYTFWHAPKRSENSWQVRCLLTVQNYSKYIKKRGKKKRREKERKWKSDQRVAYVCQNMEWLHGKLLYIIQVDIYGEKEKS